jgi:hypothetical protein
VTGRVRLGKGRLPSAEVCFARYLAACDALHAIRARADAAAREHASMRGTPNEIAKVGGEADGLREAADVLESALRKAKP